MAEFFHWREDDLLLQVRVQPRSSRDQVAGLLDDRLKIKITAPPVDGKANAHLVKYLSGQFKTPVSRIAVLSGHSTRNKQLLISRPTVVPDWLK
jgi:uncharacterized protein (TIGR00251 family)